MRLTPRSKAVPFCPRSDRSEESQWLMKLHTYGLLRNSFRLAETMEGVRTIWRLRDRHVKQAGRSVQHMQKALTKMNVQLANVISDISGVSGQAIIAAILKGERDPYKLADLKHERVQASREEVARSLEGNWRPDVLFEFAAGRRQLPIRAPADAGMRHEAGSVSGHATDARDPSCRPTRLAAGCSRAAGQKAEKA